MFDGNSTFIIYIYIRFFLFFSREKLVPSSLFSAGFVPAKKKKQILCQFIRGGRGEKGKKERKKKQKKNKEKKKEKNLFKKYIYFFCFYEKQIYLK